MPIGVLSSYKIKLALKKNPCPYPDTRNTSMDLKAFKYIDDCFCYGNAPTYART